MATGKLMLYDIKYWDAECSGSLEFQAKTYPEAIRKFKCGWQLFSARAIPHYYCTRIQDK